LAKDGNLMDFSFSQKRKSPAADVPHRFGLMLGNKLISYILSNLSGAPP